MIRMMLCQLLDSFKDVSTSEWRYAWQEVQVDPATREVTAILGGRSGTTTENYGVIPGNPGVVVDPADPPLTPYQTQQRGYVENVMTWWVFEAVTGSGLKNFVAVFKDATTLETLDVEARPPGTIGGDNYMTLMVHPPGTAATPEPRPGGTALLRSSLVGPELLNGVTELQLLCPALDGQPYLTGYINSINAATTDFSCSSIQQLFRFEHDATTLVSGALTTTYDAADGCVAFSLTAFAVGTTPLPTLRAKFSVNGQEMVSRESPNLWVAQNVFQPPNIGTTAVVVQGLVGQLANIVEFTSGGNTAGVNPAGQFFGSGAQLTNLNASALTSGTVPPARIPVVDGGTW